MCVFASNALDILRRKQDYRTMTRALLLRARTASRNGCLMSSCLSLLLGLGLLLTARMRLLQHLVEVLLVCGCRCSMGVVATRCFFEAMVMVLGRHSVYARFTQKLSMSGLSMVSSSGPPLNRGFHKYFMCVLTYVKFKFYPPAFPSNATQHATPPRHLGHV